MTSDDAGLEIRRRRLVQLSAAVATGEDGRTAGAMDRCAEAVERGELEQREVEEALLQSYLFLGYPATLAAMEAWRTRLPDPSPEDDPLARPDGLEAWRERGEEVCRRVYGTAYRDLRETVHGLHPTMDRWMVTEGYGKVLGRPGLALVDRELCIVAILAVLGRDPQLHSHLRGALRAGAASGTVEAVLERALRSADAVARRASARRVWRRVRDRAQDRETGGGACGEGPCPGGPGGEIA